MTTLSATAAVPRVQLPGRRYDRFFFAGMILIFLVTVFVGFARTHPLHPRRPEHRLDGPVAGADAPGVDEKVAIHRRLGIAGFPLAAAMHPMWDPYGA